MSIISVKSLRKEYRNGEKIALDGVNFTVNKGEIIGILGRNGSGKSTLFKIICKVLEANSGTVEVFNESGREDNIGYLPEVRGLNPRQNVFIHLCDILCYKGIKRNDAMVMVEKYLKKFRMGNLKETRIDTLSKGNQQKIQFISAIANEPEILILDEPFSGLDVIAISDFWEIIEELKKKGTTILFSSHDLDNGILKSDKFLFLVSGKVVDCGSIEELQERNIKILEISMDDMEKNSIILNNINSNFTIDNNTAKLEVFTEKEAEDIFNKLERPFCRKFVLRNQTIKELFCIYNSKERPVNDEESEIS